MSVDDNFQYKDFSNNASVRSNFKMAKTFSNPPVDADLLQTQIREMENRIQELKAERDAWHRIATTIARFASAKPHAYYGRSVDFIIQHAEKNA